MGSAGKKPFGSDITADLADEFLAYCEAHGHVKYRAVEAALRAFMALPVEAQVKLMSSTVTDIRTLLADALVSRQIDQNLVELGPARAEFLRLLEQAIERTSVPKKAKR